MTTHVSTQTGCGQGAAASRTASGAGLFENWSRALHAEVTRWRWRRDARRLLTLDARMVRDMGFEREALRAALEQGWTEAETRQSSRSDI
ncbi:MAG TPA: hypothetical protein VHB74_10055 [Devosia sp.]|nr:hypothetical protein [Devosia sp.]